MNSSFASSTNYIAPIRFHQIRAGQDWATKDGTETSLDHYTSAMLVLDTRA